MPSTPSDLHFQAAVERTLPLSFGRQDGAPENRDCTVTVVAERDGLDAADVVVDFRLLEAELDRALGALQGPCADGPQGVAKRIADALAPSIAPPAWLSSVSIQDGAGRRVTVVLSSNLRFGQ